jgi:hypothetical protein
MILSGCGGALSIACVQPRVTSGGPVRYTVDVGPDDAGVRVTVRRRLPDGGLGDVLGELLSWSEGTLSVRRRTGEIVEVAEADVVAAKRIPPPPVRRPRA